MRGFVTPVFLLLSASACASGSASTQAAQVIAAQYSAIERGDLQAWASHYADDAILIGTDPAEVYVGQAAILASVTKNASARMQSDVTRTYKSTAQHVGVAPDQKSAWIADVIDYRVTAAGKEQVFNFRMTSLLAEERGAWKIRASVYSVAVPDEEAFSKPSPAPAPIPDLVAPGAEPLAAIVAQMTEVPHHFAGLFSAREDVFLYGTAPKERLIGGAEIQKFTRQNDPPGAIRMTRIDGVLAQLAPSKTTGFIAYNAKLSVPVEGATIDLPVRVFAVFLDENGTWLKVQEHVSLAVPD